VVLNSFFSILLLVNSVKEIKINFMDFNTPPDMSLLAEIKENLYQRKLKQCSKRDRQTLSCNFDTARNIGILFDASKETDTQIVLSFKRRLLKDRKKVSIMGYKDTKELNADEKHPVFCNKDLGLSQTPKKEDVLNFIQKPFDLLIALHIDDCQPLEYIAAASAAKFRIGHYRENKTDFYDFMVYGKSENLNVIIEQMETYLKKIY
jgi:hypothetical protein